MLLFIAFRAGGRLAYYRIGAGLVVGFRLIEIGTGAGLGLLCDLVRSDTTARVGYLFRTGCRL